MNALSHLMLLPTLNCPAACGYCFGPHQGSSIMRRETLEAVVRWVRVVDESQEIEITFHGGEPLLASIRFYETASPCCGMDSPRVASALPCKATCGG